MCKVNAVKIISSIRTTNEPLDVIVLLCYSINCMRVSIQLLAAIQINQLID